MRITRVLLAFVLLCCVFNVFAVINFSKSNVRLSDDKKSMRIAVYNTGKHKAYVKIVGREVFCKNISGSFNCSSYQLKETSFSKQLRFIPNKLILNAGQSKIVWVKWVGPLPNRDLNIGFYGEDYSKEATKVVSINGDQGLRFKIFLKSRFLAHAFIAKHNSKFVPPALKRNGKKLVIKNNGTTAIKIKAKEQCISGNDCKGIHYNKENILNIYLIPNKEIQVNLPFDAPVSIEYFNDKQNQYAFIKSN